MDNEIIKHTSSNQNSDSEVKTDLKEALLYKLAYLTRQVNELDANISRLQKEYYLQLEQLQAQKKPLEDALHHVKALLRFEGSYEKNITNIVEGGVIPAKVAGASVTDAAFDLLSQAHQPMHYKDIAVKLQERNTYVPGKDPAATLLTRMTRDNRFKRTKKRGVYILSTWRVSNSKSARNRPPRKQAIILPQPWELHIGRLQDLVASGKVKNRFSLFALGIPYGRG
jgi:hypothetical protein